MSSEGLPPPDLLAWANGQPDVGAAWVACPRPDWQIWLAAHRANMTDLEKRRIIRVATDLLPEPRGWSSVARAFAVLPLARDVAVAWTRGDEDRFDLGERVVSINQAFIVAVIIVAVVGLLRPHWLRGSVGRDLFAAAVTLATTAILYLPLATIRRVAIQHATSRMTFSEALNSIFPQLVGISEQASPADRSRLAQSVRVNLGALHFTT